MGRKLLKAGLIIIVVLLFSAAALYGYYKLCIDPYRGTVREMTPSLNLNETLSKENALEDLAYLMKCLRERHPAWLDDSGKDILAEEQYKKELTEINDQISVLELWQSASRIAAALHDGHTFINWYGSDYRYIDDFTAIQTYGRPLTINGALCQDVLAAYRAVFSYETDYYAEASFWQNVIICEQTLQLCGIDTSDGVVMSFNVDGTDSELHFDFVTLDKVKGWQPSDMTGKWVTYQIDRENSLGIFTLTSCTCNDEYYNVLDDFFKEIFAEGIENIAVDLRGNGGGNSWVANEFIKYLDITEFRGFDSAVRYGRHLVKNENVTYKNQKKKQVFSGNLYVLTDTWTYSSAMDFAMLIADNDLGMIIGQPSGNLPDGYGDCLSFQMPNSRLSIGVSYKKWYRVDQTRAGEPLMPDVETAPEEALEKVYELILH